MKLTFLPTMTDLREMLGDKLYIEFVWMWREQEQAVRSQERRAKWAEQLPARNSEDWPHPLFSRVESAERVSAGQVKAAEPKPAQRALLHPTIQRLLEQKSEKPDWLDTAGTTDQDDEPVTAEERARGVAYRSAAE
jgi:hypothetical protein